jgi:hypothetical protein
MSIIALESLLIDTQTTAYGEVQDGSWLKEDEATRCRLTRERAERVHAAAMLGKQARIALTKAGLDREEAQSLLDSLAHAIVGMAQWNHFPGLDRGAPAGEAQARWGERYERLRTAWAELRTAAEDVGLVTNQSQDPGPPNHSTTAGEKVARYIDDTRRSRGIPNLAGAANATGLSQHKIRKVKEWQNEEGQQLEQFLRDRPNAEIPDVKRQFGWGASKTSGMKAWKSHMEKRDARKTLPAGQEKQLQEVSLESRPDDRAVDPRAAFDTQDEIFEGLLERASPPTKGRLRKLQEPERERLVRALFEKLHDEKIREQLNGRSEEDCKEILLHLAEDWLVEEEQSRRRRDRPDKRR